MFPAEGSRQAMATAILLAATVASSATASTDAAEEAQPSEQLASASLLATDWSPETIIVIATRVATAIRGAPASVTLIDQQQLRERNLVRPGDALANVPGLYIRGAAMGANFPGTGQAVLSLRGIPRTPRTLVMLDGQPMNNALSGGVNVVGIPLDSIERIEIVRGPYSALYGGNAMGGAINFISAGPDEPIAEMHAGVGTLFQRGAGLVVRQRTSGGLGITLSAGWRASDGYQGSDLVLKRVSPGAVGTPVSGAVATTTPDGQTRLLVGSAGPRPWWQGSGQFALHYAPTDSLRLVAGVGWAEYSVRYSRPESYLKDQAGNPVFSGPVLVGGDTPQRLVLAETDFFTITPTGERDLRAFLRAEQQLGEDSLLRLNLATLRHLFSYSTARAGVARYDSGPGELTHQPNARIDLDLSLHTPIAPGFGLTVGAAINRSTMDRSTRDLANWRDQATATATNTMGIGRATNLALFAQSEHQLGGGLHAYLGGRFDRYETSGRVVDHGRGFDESYASRRFQQFSPKVALLLEASDWLSLRASYGQGFRPPALLDMYSLTVPPTVTAGIISVILPAPDLRPERVRSFEAGADLRAGGASASATLYRQRLSDLIYRRSLTADGTQSRNDNAGAASVDGIEASLGLPMPLSGLKLAASFTHHFRYEITRNDAAPATVGKVLTDVPKTSWSASLDYADGPWTALLAARHSSHVFGSGNDTNTNVVEGVFGSYDAHTVVSAKLGRRVTRNLTLSLSGENLLNRQYYVYSGQPGRTLFGEARWRF